MVEGREGADNAAHDGHRVRIAAEAVEEILQLLVNHGVVLDGVVELGLLFCAGQFALEQQEAGLQEVGFLGQLIDRVAAVQEYTLVAVDVGDLGFTGRSGHKARVEGEYALGGQAAYVHNVGAHGPGIDWQLDGGRALDDQLRLFVSH